MNPSSAFVGSGGTAPVGQVCGANFGADHHTAPTCRRRNRCRRRGRARPSSFSRRARATSLAGCVGLDEPVWRPGAGEVMVGVAEVDDLDRSVDPSTLNPGGLGNPWSRRSRNLCGAGDGFPEPGFEAIGVLHRLDVQLGVQRDGAFTRQVPLGA